MEKPEIAGDKRSQPVGCRWTTSCTACGSICYPQAVEILRPRIHSQVTWSDGPAPGAPVDTVWTTSQSPGCGREKVTESVESGRNPAVNRTPGERWTTAAGRGSARIRRRIDAVRGSDRPGSPRDRGGSASGTPRERLGNGAGTARNRLVNGSKPAPTGSGRARDRPGIKPGCGRRRRSACSPRRPGECRAPAPASPLAFSRRPELPGPARSGPVRPRPTRLGAPAAPRTT